MVKLLLALCSFLNAPKMVGQLFVEAYHIMNICRVYFLVALWVRCHHNFPIYIKKMV